MAIAAEHQDIPQTVLVKQPATDGSQGMLFRSSNITDVY